MATTTRSIETVDGLGLHTEIWRPACPPTHAVVISHGAGEHVSRYDHLAQRLVDGGALVLGADHRGQGRSGGARGHVDRFEQYSDDLARMVRGVAAELPSSERPDSIPWFLFGHSMGGLIALLTVLDHAEHIPLRGAVISAPLLRPKLQLGPGREVLLRLLQLTAPQLSFESGLGLEGLSRDPAVRSAWIRDRRGARRYSAAWLGAMRRAVDRVERELPRVKLPMLWYVGTSDAVVEHRATIRTFAVLPQPRLNDQRLELFEGYFHELHNEPAAERERVLELVRSWVHARIRSRELRTDR